MCKVCFQQVSLRYITSLDSKISQCYVVDQKECTCLKRVQRMEVSDSQGKGLPPKLYEATREDFRQDQTHYSKVGTRLLRLALSNCLVKSLTHVEWTNDYKGWWWWWWWWWWRSLKQTTLPFSFASESFFSSSAVRSALKKILALLSE